MIENIKYTFIQGLFIVFNGYPFEENIEMSRSTLKVFLFPEIVLLGFKTIPTLLVYYFFMIINSPQILKQILN